MTDPYSGKTWRELRTVIADYEGSICFETTCTNCGRMLDQLHGAEAQLGKATELIERLEKDVRTLKQIQGGGDRIRGKIEGVNLALSYAREHLPASFAVEGVSETNELMIGEL